MILVYVVIQETEHLVRVRDVWAQDQAEAQQKVDTLREQENVLRVLNMAGQEIHEYDREDA